MKIKYREKKYFCGEFIEVDIYPVRELPKGKRIRAKPSSVAQKLLNDHNRVKKLTRLLNTNFTENDVKIELTYSDKELPADEDEADRNLRNFFRRIKRFRKKNNLPELKYIVVTEQGKRTKRFHHHIVMSGGMLLSDIKNIWGKGIIRQTQIEYGEKGLDGLAKYMSKNLTNGAVSSNQKLWHASRNLVYPKERTNDNKISKRKAKELYENQECREPFEKLYPDYEYIESEAKLNPLDGQYYICISLRKRQIHTSGGKGKKKAKK